MKTFGKLKLAAVSALIVLGMSSCLKNDDPDFAIGTQSAYILQEGSGTSARFMPAIRLMGNRALQSATCQLDGETYRFSKVEANNPYYMEIEPSYQYSTDTIMDWTCKLSATSTEETPVTVQTSFSFTAGPKLGAFNVTELKYIGNSNKVEGKWNKVDNASGYCLMIKLQNSKMFIPYKEISVGSGDELSGSVSIPLENGAKCDIAIGAINKSKSIITISRSLSITAGTDTE